MPTDLHMSELIGKFERMISLQAYEALGALYAIYS